jgi:glucose/arabinose dehydrogenase
MGAERRRARSTTRRHATRPDFDALEDRVLLANPPFAVGGDPLVNPSDFRVTTFASGLNYPKGLMTLADGSILVAVNNPTTGFTDFYHTTGELLRFTDADGDGVADGPGQVLYNGLPGGVTAIHQAGEFILATSTQSGSERISVLRAGASPSAALSLVGSIDFSFPSPWEHTTFASVIRPTPGQPGNYDVIFNIGSQYNGVVIGSDGNVVLDATGNPTYQPTTGTVSASGLVTGTLQGDSLYMVTLHDAGGTPVFSNLTQVASSLRNAASLAIDPATGDLYIADNGIDGNDGGNEAWSTDELDRIPAAQIGATPGYFGFPELVDGQLIYSYVKTNDLPGQPVRVISNTVAVPPLISFEPLPDAALPATGSESEGASGFALSPPDFPAGLNHGVFIGFHGIFDTGGTANEENPMLFADPATGHYFDFISNDLPNIGHLDEALTTTDSLFVADISQTGDVFTSNGVGQGVVYQIQAIPPPANHAPSLAPIQDQTIDEGQTLTAHASATDPDVGQTLTFSLGPGSPRAARIDPTSGLVTWSLPQNEHIGAYSFHVIVTDNGSPPLSDTVSFTVNVVDTNPATITRATVSLRHGLAISLTLSEPLDPTTALAPQNYSLAFPAKSGKKLKNSRPPRTVALSVRLNPASNVVTLTAKGKLKFNPDLVLTVVGAGLGAITKDTGLALAGTGGQPGTNYVAAVTAKKVRQIHPV